MVDVVRDSLTGLPNLISLVDELRTLPPAGLLVAVDLADFSAVNREHGRETGDRMLQIVAAGLQDAGDRCAGGCRVYRLGDDEFVLHLPAAAMGPAPAPETSYLRDLAIDCGERLAAAGLPPVAIRTAVARYPAEGVNVAALLARLEDALAAGTDGSPGPGGNGRWVEGLLGWFIGRLTETVDALRTANRLAFTDPVTGMPNHRAAEAHIDSLLERQAAGAPCFAVLFIDGDNLKSYNERLGYEAGNKMLRALGAVISGHLRGGDQVSRWLSGDEFLAVLPGADTPIATAVAERIRTAVETESTGWPLQVTVSIGVASCPAAGTTETELLSAAAEANAEAKRAGKNRVVARPQAAAIR